MLNPELEQALKKIDVEAYLDREGIDYRHSHGTRGLQLNLRECPVCHGEGFKTYLNAESGLGNCNRGSCGFKFNRFKLVRAVSGLSGKSLDDHIFEVASQQGWMPKKVHPVLVRGELKLPTKTTPLPNEGRNLAYLAKRGIDADTAARFSLHYCKDGWWGYKLADGTEKWMNFGKRVIIPVCDLEGTMVSFQGRDITGEQEPKYQFPNGYAVAGSHLYNGQNFADGVTRHLIVGEGAFDVIAIDLAITDVSGCQSMLAVGTFGKHLSEGPDGQLAKLLLLKERGLEVITMMWDAERAALVDAIKAGLKLMGSGFKVRIARLPDGKDPNEVPPSAVVKAIFEAVPLTRLAAVRLMSESMRL